MVYPFQIRPCETQVRSMHMINSFMYRSKTIASAYEGAGWAFPTKTYHNSPLVGVHFQGFEILHCMHFLPTLIPSTFLESSLKPNWLPPVGVMAEEWGFVQRSDTPWQHDWNEAFDSYHCSLYYQDPAYKAHCHIQHLLKSAQTQNELDTIYEGLKERPR